MHEVKAHWTIEQAVDRFFTPRPTELTKRDIAMLDTGETRSLECGLVATAWGTGPRVLMAHGWESRRSHWTSYLDPLISAGFQMVAVDAPAHGDSPGKQANVILYGRLLAEAAKELGPLAGIIGHSFGAGAATIAVSRGASIHRAVLISSPGSLTCAVSRWAMRHGYTGEELQAFLREVERRIGDSLVDADLPRAASRNQIPALIIHDRDDESIPVAEGRAIAEAWPNSQWLETTRFGHRRILLAKEVIAKVVAFLKS